MTPDNRPQIEQPTTPKKKRRGLRLMAGAGLVSVLLAHIAPSQPQASETPEFPTETTSQPAGAPTEFDLTLRMKPKIEEAWPPVTTEHAVTPVKYEPVYDLGTVSRKSLNELGDQLRSLYVKGAESAKVRPSFEEVDDTTGISDSGKEVIFGFFQLVHGPDGKQHIYNVVASDDGQKGKKRDLLSISASETELEDIGFGEYAVSGQKVIVMNSFQENKIKKKRFEYAFNPQGIIFDQFNEGLGGEDAMAVFPGPNPTELSMGIAPLKKNELEKIINH